MCARARAQWVMKPPPSAQTASPASSTRAAHRCWTPVGHRGPNLPGAACAFTARTCSFIFVFDFSHQLDLKKKETNNIARFLPKTFPYDSRTWGQVLVSLGETSLFCCYCCCWTVRLHHFYCVNHAAGKISTWGLIGPEKVIVFEFSLFVWCIIVNNKNQI